MATPSSNLTFFSTSAFKLSRPTFTTNGFSSVVDPKVLAFIEELNTLFGKRILPNPQAPAANQAHHARQGQKAGEQKADGQQPADPFQAVKALLSPQLTPKYAPQQNQRDWAAGTLADVFNSTAENANHLTLSDLIDQTPELSALKFQFQNVLAQNWNSIDYNTQQVLGDDAGSIKDFLVAYGYLIGGISDPNGFLNFVGFNQLGAPRIIHYVIASAAREQINDEQINVSDYNTDDSDFLKRLAASSIVISTASFKTSVEAVIDDFVFNSNASKLIDIANKDLAIDPLLLQTIRPKLIELINTSKVPIVAQNAKLFLPMLIEQALANPIIVVPGSGAPGTAANSDDGFSVTYLTDNQAVAQVSQTAVLCAAQLYYSMVVGDQLDVFDAVNYFTHKYLVRERLEIADPQLRSDLQLYVFSNKFIDRRTGQINDRSRPAERHMFYRQVFNWGVGQITDDVVVNREYPRLWKILMLESAKYIERAQVSFNPTSYVSRQNVQQAVEDLQYNLSLHCTGMANVITPLIYAELDFVISRILSNDEIVQQLVPHGGSWWRVVETLYIGMKNARPRATTLYNKAKLGDTILRKIATYDPSTFESDGPFSDFISAVDAFITTQSILQKGLTEALIHGDHDPDDDGQKAHDADDDGAIAAKAGNGGAPGGSAMNGSSLNGGLPGAAGLPQIPGMPGQAAAGAGSDEWAF